MGSFASIAGTETALTCQFGRHAFENAAILRVSHTLYNYRVWVVVCAVRYEPVSVLISALLQGIFANSCPLSENAPRFAALIQWLPRGIP